MNKKPFEGSKGKGSKPIRGNISDNKLSILLEIPKTTISDWKKTDNYRNRLYWFLKSMTEDEIKEYKEKSKEFKNL